MRHSDREHRAPAATGEKHETLGHKRLLNAVILPFDPRNYRPLTTSQGTPNFPSSPARLQSRVATEGGNGDPRGISPSRKLLVLQAVACSHLDGPNYLSPRLLHHILGYSTRGLAVLDGHHSFRTKSFAASLARQNCTLGVLFRSGDCYCESALLLHSASGSFVLILVQRASLWSRRLSDLITPWVGSNPIQCPQSTSTTSFSVPFFSQFSLRGRSRWTKLPHPTASPQSKTSFPRYRRFSLGISAQTLYLPGPGFCSKPFDSPQAQLAPSAERTVPRPSPAGSFVLSLCLTGLPPPARHPPLTLRGD